MKERQRQSWRTQKGKNYENCKKNIKRKGTKSKNKGEGKKEVGKNNREEGILKKMEKEDRQDTRGGKGR